VKSVICRYRIARQQLRCTGSRGAQFNVTRLDRCLSWALFIDTDGNVDGQVFQEAGGDLSHEQHSGNRPYQRSASALRLLKHKWSWRSGGHAGDRDCHHIGMNLLAALLVRNEHVFVRELLEQGGRLAEVRGQHV
jgi:hypothetical protein